MPVVVRPQDFNVEDLYIDLRPMLGRALYVKCEGFNFAGSVKLKAAVEMVEEAERRGELRPDSILVESSSGNLGVALSIVASNKGYRFVCVTDLRCNHATRRIMETLGTRVHVVTEPDDEGGFLGARLRHVRELLDSDDRYVWPNQYANPNNWRAHYRRTAPAIARQFPDLDVLFVGAGTTGTLMGCARFFRKHRPWVTLVAVDAHGSVTFGQQPRTRLIPGLGTSVRPPIVNKSMLDDVVHVSEADTVSACHRLARAGFLLGGSTGTVVAGACRWLAGNRAGTSTTAVTISPDLGERYLDSIYHEDWLAEHFGEVDLERAQLDAGSLPAPSPAWAQSMAMVGRLSELAGVGPGKARPAD
ncbi:2,3-diaminopropionate biosynthesis protein SbnA [Micromonospora profundi]|uniref:2,3-diaminopropionate biosynthesis protein SbnA n=1 Tax=Micromonospora profundi TaxID=1420889 RepID=UPI0033B9FBD2